MSVASSKARLLLHVTRQETYLLFAIYLSYFELFAIYLSYFELFAIYLSYFESSNGK